MSAILGRCIFLGTSHVGLYKNMRQAKEAGATSVRRVTVDRVEKIDGVLFGHTKEGTVAPLF